MQNRMAPVTGQDRIEALDTLRGFALLGILVMNVTGMAMPMAAYFNPMVYGGQTGLDYGAWVFAHLFFDFKMLAIFSMLFGAGLVLQFERAEAAGRPLAGVWYRRTFWLLVIGLLHAYLIWHGDILVTYALCGFFLFLFRRRSPRALIVLGLVFLLLGGLLSVGGGFAQEQLRDVAAKIQGRVEAGEALSERQQGLLEQWNDVRANMAPTEEEIRQFIETMRGEPGKVLRANIHETRRMHVEAVPFFLFWRAMALMLLGMGLMKAGVFTASRSIAFYRNWIIAGFGIGLPVIAWGVIEWHRLNYDFIAQFRYAGQFNYYASVLVAMAWVGVVMLICKTGRLVSLRERLAAVGRMALTNYLTQSVLAVLVFYGYGLGLFGEFGRFGQWWFILAVWALQLLWSPWWLVRYRFGPAEWFWRTLTYGRRQPMRR